METDAVKLEIDNICRGCLSVDRNLKQLSKDCADIFFSILGSESFVPEDSMYFNLLLCWECTSILKKILIYQKRFQRSQILISREWAGPFTVESLSVLTICNKDNYDATFEYNEEQINNIKKEIDLSKEELVFEVKNDKDDEIIIKEEACNDINDDISVNDDINDDISVNDDDNDDFVDIFDKIEFKKKKKSNPVGLCKKSMKRSLVNYDSGIDRHTDKCQLKIKDIRDIVNKGREKNKNIILPRMFTAMTKIVETMDADLEQDETIETVECSHCEHYTGNRHSLNEHWNEHSVDVIKCTYCGAMSVYDSEMSRHLKSYHKYSIKCVCGFVCWHRKDYYLHYRKYHMEYVCDHCKSRYLRKEKLEKHMRENHLPNKCDLCDRVYSKKCTLVAHYWSFHQEFKGQTSELTYCVECDMHFENHFLYNRHLRLAVAHKPRVPKKIPCPECGKIFSKTNYMNRHFNLIHKQKTKYYCEICDKYLSSGYSMRNHTKYVHLKEEKKRDKLCKICGKCFFSNMELNRHMRTHTGERPFKCGFCDSTFTQDNSRKTHERTQHKEVGKVKNKIK